MGDNVVVTAGTGTTVAADEVVDGTLGTVKVQYVKIMDGTADGTTKAAVDAGGLAVGTITPGTAATSLGKAEDAAHTSGDVGVQMLAVRKDTSSTGIGANGDYVPLAVDSTGKLYTTIDSTQLGTLGQTTMSASVPVTIASNQSAVPAISGGSQYETVAISQTDQALGATGATGDYLESLICVVATAATSSVSIKDGAGSAISILPAAVGAGVGTYILPVGLISLAGAWKVTTGAGVTVIATGRFT